MESSALQHIEQICGRLQDSSAALEDAHFDAALEAASAERATALLSPYLPSRARSIAEFLQIVPLSEEDVLLDIGCGDGRVALACRTATGCGTVGVDVSPLCIAAAVQAEEQLLEKGAEGKCVWILGDVLDPKEHEREEIKSATVWRNEKRQGKGVPHQCLNDVL